MSKFPPAISCLELVHQGKVRDTFALPNFPGGLLVVATNRVSTHNKVHKSQIPYKGEILTAIVVFCLTHVLVGIPHHLVAYGEDIYKYVSHDMRAKLPPDLHRYAIVVKKLEMLPVEFVFRSRMAGSLWKDYYSKGLPNPYGQDLPEGLQLMSPFSKTIFTPTDKSETDEPLPWDEVVQQYGAASQLAWAVYEQGRKFALPRGIEILDGKSEMGIDPKTGEVTLGDEFLTPDCCRYVRADSIIVGQEPSWLDKEFVRRKAEQMWGSGPREPLEFPAEVIEETTRRYAEIYQALTGQDFWSTRA